MRFFMLEHGIMNGEWLGAGPSASSRAPFDGNAPEAATAPSAFLGARPFLFFLLGLAFSLHILSHRHYQILETYFHSTGVACLH